MRRLAIPCVLALCCAAAQAQGEADLMQTPQCLAARKQLDEAFAAGGPRDRLAAARAQAALACFGVRPPPPPESRSVPPPAALDPIRLRPEPALRPPPAPSAPPAAVPPPPGPIVITTCDATGCWDASGARYHEQGPVLLGPRGVCTRQNGLLNCP